MSHPTTALSVNVNKVALVRNTRHLGIPSVTRAATLCLQAGAHGITVHPRPDQRHIRPADVQALVSRTHAAWLSEQMAVPHQNDYLAAVQAQYDQGDAWRPQGAQYSPAVVAQTFWKTAATAPDQLRKRVAFALHQIFMVSQNDSNLWHHARAVADYIAGMTDRFAIREHERLFGTVVFP